jgi:hypothetical protein
MHLNPASFLPHLKGLRFDHVEIAERRITLTVLKTLKRQMFGRAGLALLRERMLDGG